MNKNFNYGKWIIICTVLIVFCGLIYVFLLFGNGNYNSIFFLIDKEPKEYNDAYSVYIETGHGTDENGDWDTGCTWRGDEEAKLMIPIAKATAHYLEKNGVRVYTDAYTGNNSNLNHALDFLDKNDVDVFVNIHCDYDEADSGTLPLYNKWEQKKLAWCLNEGVHSYVNIDDRGIEWRDDLETLCNKKVHCPSCLYETGCISKDNEIIKTKYNELGKGLAKGICRYLGIGFNEKEE